MKNIQSKLLAIQSALKVNKSQWNDFGGYNYRSCEDILEAVKPLCVLHEVVLTITDEMVQLGDRFYAKATAILSDGTDTIRVSAFAREALSKKGMDEAQITGSSSSYARKYALNGMFCIDDTKDADSTNKHGKDEDDKKPEQKKEQATLDPAITKLIDECKLESELTDLWKTIGEELGAEKRKIYTEKFTARKNKIKEA